MFELVLTLSGLILVGPGNKDWSSPNHMDVRVLDARNPQGGCDGHPHEAWLTVESRFLTSRAVADINAFAGDPANAGRVRIGQGSNGRPTLQLSLEPLAGGPIALTFPSGAGGMTVSELLGLPKISRVDPWAEHIAGERSLAELSLDRVAATLTLRGGRLTSGGARRDPKGNPVPWFMVKADGSDSHGGGLEIPDYLEYRLPGQSVATLQYGTLAIELEGRGEPQVPVAITNHPRMLMEDTGRLDHFVQYYDHLDSGATPRPSCSELRRPSLEVKTETSSAVVLCPPGGVP